MVKLYLENFEHKCAIPNEKLNFLNWVYAHGKIHAGYYDYLHEDKKKHFDKRRNINGEECIAVLPTGEEVEALFFYWKAVHVYTHKLIFGGTYRQVWVQPRGLLVAKTDTHSIEQARKCYRKAKDL